MTRSSSISEADHSVAPEARVVFLLEDLNSGGAERAVLNLASSSDLDCLVVAEMRRGDLIDDPLAGNVVFASDDTTRRSRPIRVARLRRILSRLQPDLLVSALSPVVSTIASRSLGVPVMHWVQAPWSQTTDVSGNGARAVVGRWVLRRVGRFAKLVACATPGLMAECAGLGVPQSRLALLPNGLDFPPSLHQKPQRGSEDAVIVTVGRLEPPKRHDLLIEATASLKTSGHSVQCVIVGSGRCRGELESLARSLGVSNQVEFTGFVTSPSSYYAEADAFVLATDYEGFGNVIVEALGAGVPVIVSDVPYGPRFILDDGRYGRLVRPASAGALADAIREVILAQGPSDAERDILRARAAAFSLERVAERFDALVRTSLEQIPFSEESFRDWK